MELWLLGRRRDRPDRNHAVDRLACAHRRRCCRHYCPRRGGLNTTYGRKRQTWHDATGDQFEDQYTSATADLSPGGVAAAVESMQAQPSEPWPGANIDNERIGQASRSENYCAIRTRPTTTDHWLSHAPSVSAPASCCRWAAPWRRVAVRALATRAQQANQRLREARTTSPLGWANICLTWTSCRTARRRSVEPQARCC